MAFKFGPEQVAIVSNWTQFDADWYRNEYPDVRLASMDPAYHYLWLGQRIGRRPSAQFDAFVGRRLDPLEMLRLIQEGSYGDALEYARIDVDHPRSECAAEFMAVGEADTRDLRGLSIAVHAHMYYADLTEEFAAYLNRMPCPFDLYVSTPDEKAQVAVQQVFSTIANAAHLDVRVVPNIGRDIAPLVVEFGAVLAGYDVVCHIQTKRSLYNGGATDGWREYIIDALFPSPERIAFLLRALARYRYGIVYPQSFYNLPYLAHTWLANSGIARAWAPRFGVDVVPDGYFDFPAGSMFWARSDAIRPLLEAGIQWSDFPPEQGQTDGTLAHCIERMLGVVPTSRKVQHGVIRDKRYPSWSRWRINQFLQRPLDHVHAAITDPTIKVVAFDIFDTLLLRHLIDPDYLKKALDLRHEAAGAPGFRALRASSEAEARDRKGSDVDIHEIYAGLMQSAGPDRAFAVNEEILLEIASVRPRKEIVELLAFAVDAGKRVILASDMFLTRDAIEEMLRRSEVAGWQKLYLSSEIGFRKDRGDMYDYILKAERLQPGELLMIGDNERSDFQIPADMGIRTVHAIKPINIMRATPRLEPVIPDAAEAPSGEQFLFGALAAENFSGLSFPGFSPGNMFGPSARSIGYGLLGPISLAFSQWLVASSGALGIKRLYFLSREGKFLKAAYEAWVDGLDVDCSSDYLLASRRAVTVPCIGEQDDIEHIAESNNFYGESLEMFLKERYGVELDDRWWRRLESRNLWKRGRALSIEGQDIRHIRPLLAFLAPVIIERAGTEREAALAYFAKMNVAKDDRAAVVDVGYGGTIQRHLGKLLNAKVHGLYMMANPSAEAWSRSAGVMAKGFFASMKRDEPGQPSAMLANSFLLEKMLSANDEQLLCYTAGGGLEFRDMLAYVNEGRAARDEMQRGALDFVQDAVRFRNTISEDVAISAPRVQDLFERFVTELSEDERKIFSSLMLDDFYCGRGVVIE